MQAGSKLDGAWPAHSRVEPGVPWLYTEPCYFSMVAGQGLLLGQQPAQQPLLGLYWLLNGLSETWHLPFFFCSNKRQMPWGCGGRCGVGGGVLARGHTGRHIPET